MRDEFLSEEDLDLRNLSTEELYAWWDEWLRLAQATNDLDQDSYSHGVFRVVPRSLGSPEPEATSRGAHSRILRDRTGEQAEKP